MIILINLKLLREQIGVDLIIIQCSEAPAHVLDYKVGQMSLLQCKP